MDEQTGDLIEGDLDVTGGQFVFPRNGFGIDFTGFHGVLEFAWKATLYHHLTLPSSSPLNSSHTCLGYSCQLPTKTQAVLKNIKNNFYLNHQKYKDWGVCDIKKIFDDSLACPKTKKILNKSSPKQKPPKKAFKRKR